MKEIIDGKRYDTETAEEIYKWSSPHFPNDWHYESETLYRSEKGTWFLLGEGNGLSRYREQYIDGYGPGESIKPLTEDEAFEFLSEHDSDLAEEYFEDRIEDA